MRGFIAILIFALVICGCGGSDSSSKKSTQQSTQAVQTTPAISNEQLKEMRSAYTQVLTQTLKPICVDTAIRNENWVNVYVNSLWYELNKGQKTEFINRCKNTYAGMLGARGIRVDFNSVIIFINLQGSEKQVGKYSGISGISISE